MADFHDRRDGSVSDGAFKSVVDVQRAHEKGGGHFFDPASKRFFDSRIGRTLYSGPGGHYFVTSERYHDIHGGSDPRAYTVRQAHPNGQIDTVGEFQAHPTRSSAARMAQHLAKAQG